MAAPVIRVVGLARLVRSMREAEVSLEDLKDVTGTVARIAAVSIAREAPIGKGSKSPGRLRATIRGNKAARRARVSVGRASVPYAGPVHWGWQGTDSTGRRHNIKPNEFGVRGLQRAEPAVTREYVDGIRKILDGVRGA